MYRSLRLHSISGSATAMNHLFYNKGGKSFVFISDFELSPSWSQQYLSHGTEFLRCLWSFYQIFQHTLIECRCQNTRVFPSLSALLNGRKQVPSSVPLLPSRASTRMAVVFLGSLIPATGYLLQFHAAALLDFICCNCNAILFPLQTNWPLENILCENSSENADALNVMLEDGKFVSFDGTKSLVLLCCRFLLSMCPASFTCLSTSLFPCLETLRPISQSLHWNGNKNASLYTCTLIALMSVPGAVRRKIHTSFSYDRHLRPAFLNVVPEYADLGY